MNDECFEKLIERVGADDVKLLSQERFDDLMIKENELERCKKKCESLIKHLIVARKMGFYDYMSVKYDDRGQKR